MRDEDSESPTRSAAPVSGMISSEPAKLAGYQIRRRIGAGGMGVIYEAEQQSPRRLVALKTFRTGEFVDDRRIKLFRRETEALARLRHPGIAAIYEAGCTEDGQHFFAMELVEGVPLSAWAATASDRGSKLGDALRLFVEICHGVNYAHQRGVIHRDLKPSNIMVTEARDASASSTAAGAPGIKILDFGLARIVDTDLKATSVTRLGRIEGTLPYMSPEQTRGNPDQIDVRSDVYSLGVILYELTTGKLPYPLDSASILEAVRAINEVSPTRPSRAEGEGEGCRWKPEIRRDLEVIILKALEKSPDERYQSALALAEDIERYLSNQPISARSPTAGYQLRKLISRHKPVFAGIVLLLVMLTVFGITMAVQSARIATERDRANREAVASKQVKDFLTGMFGLFDPAELGVDVTVREILDRGAESLQSELDTQPAVQAELMNTLGGVYRSIGLYDQAAPLLSQALELREALYGPEDVLVAESIEELAILLGLDGKLVQAVALSRRSLEIRRKLLGEQHPIVISNVQRLAELLQNSGEFDGAEKLYLDALAWKRARSETADRETATILTNLASLWTLRGDEKNYARAEDYFRQAIALRRSLLGARHREVGDSLNNLAFLKMVKGDHAEAESLFREFLAINQNTMGGENPRLGVALNNLASVLNLQNRYTEAEPVAREGLGALSRVLSEGHWRIAVAESVYGETLAGLGRFGEAEPLLVESWPVIEANTGEQSKYSLDALRRIVFLYEASGRHDKRESYQDVLSARSARPTDAGSVPE